MSNESISESLYLSGVEDIGTAHRALEATGVDNSLEEVLGAMLDLYQNGRHPEYEQMSVWYFDQEEAQSKKSKLLKALQIHIDYSQDLNSANKSKELYNKLGT